jgi:nicotinate-nucleotide pyrophosphorylase (carboxylating)
MIALDSAYIDSLVRTALDEDIGSGDITTLLTVPEDAVSKAAFVAKQEGVVAGMDVARAAFRALDSDVVFEVTRNDGARVKTGDSIATVAGNARAILTAERVALNFLARMSGIGTLTAKYVKLVSHTKAKIIDTRKTTPGLRRLEKYAVTIGGGFSHRFNLSDGILIKDNHITAAGGVTAAVTSAKKGAPHTLKIECEVTTLNQLYEAIAAGADAVLLDNMPLTLLRQAVEVVAGRVITEASGGVNEQTVAAIAETGVDLISVGALTHSAPALDISLMFVETE